MSKDLSNEPLISIPPPPDFVETRDDSINVKGLLRLHLLNGELCDTTDTFCLVKVGNNHARSKLVQQNKSPLYDEQYLVEYDRHDKNSELELQLFTVTNGKDVMLGEWKRKIHDISAPGIDRSTKPNFDIFFIQEASKAEISTKNGACILYFQARREIKKYGTVEVKPRQLRLCSPFDTAETRLNGKFNLIKDEGPTKFPMPGGVYDFTGTTFTFKVDDTSNIRDIFIEVQQGNNIIGDFRIIPYDAFNYGKFTGFLPLVSRTRETIGQLDLECHATPQ